MSVRKLVLVMIALAAFLLPALGHAQSGKRTVADVGTMRAEVGYAFTLGVIEGVVGSGKVKCDSPPDITQVFTAVQMMYEGNEKSRRMPIATVVEGALTLQGCGFREGVSRPAPIK